MPEVDEVSTAERLCCAAYTLAFALLSSDCQNHQQRSEWTRSGIRPVYMTFAPSDRNH